jgi:hypothetical protein
MRKLKIIINSKKYVLLSISISHILAVKYLEILCTSSVLKIISAEMINKPQKP